MQEMIDWIEDHLFDDFSLKNLGKDMGYSPYYCSFTFHRMAGISIKKYRALRKIYLAAIELEKTEQKQLKLLSNMGFHLRRLFQELLKLHLVSIQMPLEKILHHYSLM